MKNLLLIAAMTLLSGCFDGANLSPNLTLTSSANQVEQGDSVQLVWQGEDVQNCQAAGVWTGDKPISGSEFIQLLELGNQTFSLSCEAVNSSDTLTRNTTVEVVPVDGGDGPKSGVDGDDADALYRHFNQYAQ